MVNVKEMKMISAMRIIMSVMVTAMVTDKSQYDFLDQVIGITLVIGILIILSIFLYVRIKRACDAGKY